MDCPNCHNTQLHDMLTRQGVEIDVCKKCGGVWLDKGEIYYFVKNKEAVGRNLQDAILKKKLTTKISPRTNKMMHEIEYPGGIRLDYCDHSGGIWFDAGELIQLKNQESFGLSQDNKAVVSKSEMSQPIKRTDKQINRPFIPKVMAPLPNLFLYSTMTLFGLYAAMTLFLITAVEFLGIPFDSAVGVALIIVVIIVVIQFIVGPFFMDISLRWMYKMKWVEPENLPGNLKPFIERVCKENNMKFPKFGIIDDGSPQAFTYGRSPNSARVVISRGIVELLDPDEVEAVVGHEIGHAVHWDMFLMTVAQLVPLISYYIYSTLIRMRSRGNDKNGDARIAIAVGAYVVYIVSEYFVLFFSRIREYHADRFSGNVTKNPSGLASALVKIAYGLAGKEDKIKDSKSSSNIDAVGALGIFDKGAASSIALTSYDTASDSDSSKKHNINKDLLKKAMRWDLWNPWARWYELNSTHPLVAKRIQKLSEQAIFMGQKPFIQFDERQPESYWDEFFTDFIIYAMPMLTVLSGAVYFGYQKYLHPNLDILAAHELSYFVLVLGVTMLVKNLFVYKGDFFPEMSVASLLKKVKVSGVRPVSCTVKGTVVGRGVPGYIFSEDFVLKDETGIIFLDYKQPLALWEFIFSVMKAKKYQEKEVVVSGWYHRSPMPYIKIRKIESADGISSTSYVPFLEKVTAIIIIVISLFLLAG